MTLAADKPEFRLYVSPNGKGISKTVPLSLAWRILAHQKGRTALAIGGIFVAVLLIFVELGFFIAVPQGGMLIYNKMRFDLLVTSNRYVNQAESGTFARARLDPVRANPEVAQ